MTKLRVTVSIDVELVEAGRAAVAAGRAASMSAWVTDALAGAVERDRRRAALADAVAAYEAEFGVISDDDIAEQERLDRQSARRRSAGAV